MVAALTLALTGATGFVGQHVLDLALDRGHRVRALTRRPQPPRDGVNWIEGASITRAALARPGWRRRCRDPRRGVINAHDAAGFEAGNVADRRSAHRLRPCEGRPLR